MVLNSKVKDLAVRYVAETGFFKNRLANYLTISRPTLDKIFEEDPDFFTHIKAADALFCKDLVLEVKKKNPTFLLKTRYREEFDDNFRMGAYDPEEEIKKVAKFIEDSCSSNQTPISS